MSISMKKPFGNVFAKHFPGTSLAVQCLGLRTSTAGGMGLIPGRGTEIPRAMQRGQKQKATKQKTLSMHTL